MPETKSHIQKHLRDATAAAERGDFAAVLHHIGHIMALVRKGKHGGTEQPMSGGLRTRLQGLRKP